MIVRTRRFLTPTALDSGLHPPLVNPFGISTLGQSLPFSHWNKPEYFYQQWNNKIMNMIYFCYRHNLYIILSNALFFSPLKLTPWNANCCNDAGRTHKLAMIFHECASERPRANALPHRGFHPLESCERAANNPAWQHSISRSVASTKTSTTTTRIYSKLSERQWIHDCEFIGDNVKVLCIRGCSILIELGVDLC